MIIFKSEKARELIKEFNKNLITDEFLKECETASKIFKKAGDTIKETTYIDVDKKLAEGRQLIEEIFSSLNDAPKAEQENKPQKEEQTMKKYFLIGAYFEEGMEDEARCIDVIFEKNNKEAFDNLAEYVWDYHKESIEDFDILFLLSEGVEIVARASSFTNVDFLRMEIESEGDLSCYHPVYVDIAEYDERVLISNLLDVDLV